MLQKYTLVEFVFHLLRIMRQFVLFEQCIFGKLWVGLNWATNVPTALAVEKLLAALQDQSKNKVVLIAHSQGTIIAADVLWRLWEAVDTGKLQEASLCNVFELHRAGPSTKQWRVK